MPDRPSPEDHSRFQWLKSYWKGEERNGVDQRVLPPRRFRLRFSRIRLPRWTFRWHPPKHWHERVPHWIQLKYLPQTLSARERLIVRIALFVAIVSFCMITVRFFGRHIVHVARAGGTYAEGVVGSPKYINPLLAFANDVDLDLTQLLFRGLYQINDRGEVERALASHDEVSTDGKTYIITLRQDARWHDGEPITASDVAFTFERILDPETLSPQMKVFKDLRIEVVDDYTIKMTLTKPYAPFLSTLTVGIIPQHIWGDVPPGNTTLAEYNIKPIGSGPYIFQALTKDRLGNIKSYRLVRFPEYYGPKPYLNELVFRFYPTKEDALEALRQKRIQGLSFVTADMRSQLKNSDVLFRELRLPQYTAVFFNQRTSVLKEKVVRQALERAVDKNAIIAQALDGAGEAIYTPILPGFLGYNNTIKGLAYNPDEARKALDDAGWTWLAGDATRKKSGQELRFALTTVDRPEYTKTAELLRKYWAAIGVEVELRLFSSNDIIKKTIKPRDYEALLFGEIIGTDPDPYPFWHSSQNFDPGLNLAIFANKQVDQLLEEARETNDPEQRRLKYLHFQNILSDEQPAIFLYNPFYTYALPKKVKGFTLTRISVPSDRFNGVERWYVKTKSKWQ